VRRSIPVYNWTFAQLRGVCPVMCDIAYSGAGELPDSISKKNYVQGVLTAELTANDEVKFTHPAFGVGGLLVQLKHMGDKLDREMMAVCVPLGALKEQPEIRLTPQAVSNPSTKQWTCNDVARERRLIELGWRKP